ncbi:MAG: hypothetical protein WD022_10680 [Balneolaceae bacterium]
MKSFLIWFLTVFAGAGIGYALSFVLEVNFYLLIVAGIILGSTAGITINIHQEKEALIEFEMVEMEDNREKTGEE